MIFLSYRREDAAASTGRLYDSLCGHFGEANVVRDIDTIPPGVDFAKWIAEAVGSCDSVIVVIGPSWATVVDKNGKRRLDNPKDFVRLEVAAALSRDVPVVPVMVEGASIPMSKDLPRPLKGLVKLNGLEITDSHWKHDVVKLIDGLDRLLEVSTADEAEPDATAEGSEADEPAGAEPSVPPAASAPPGPPPAASAPPGPPPAAPVVDIPPAAAQPLPPTPTGELVYELEANGIDVESVASALAEWFRALKFEVQAIRVPGGQGIQARQVQSWRKTLGMSAAMHVHLVPSGDQMIVTMGASKWTDNTAGIVTGYLLTAGVSTIAGVWQNQRLPERALAFLTSYLSSGGNVAAPVTWSARAAAWKQSRAYGSTPPPMPASAPGQPPAPAAAYPPPAVSAPWPAPGPPAAPPPPAYVPPPQPVGAPAWAPPPPPSSPSRPGGFAPPQGHERAEAARPGGWTCRGCGAARPPAARFCDACGQPAGPAT